MMSTRFSLVVLIVFVLGRASSAIELGSLEAGLLLAEEGALSACGEEWERLARGLGAPESSDNPDSVLGTTESNRSAGFAFVASSRCFDLAEDARAYRTWAQGVRYLLEANSTWIELREEVVSEMLEVEQQLASTGADELGPDSAIDVDATLLYRLEAVLEILSFMGPRAGLRTEIRKSPNRRQARSTPAVPVYIPRVFGEKRESSPDPTEPMKEFNRPLRGGVLWMSDERVRPAIYDYESADLDDGGDGAVSGSVSRSALSDFEPTGQAERSEWTRERGIGGEANSIILPRPGAGPWSEPALPTRIDTAAASAAAAATADDESSGELDESYDAFSEWRDSPQDSDSPRSYSPEENW